MTTPEISRGAGIKRGVLGLLPAVVVWALLACGGGAPQQAASTNKSPTAPSSTPRFDALVARAQAASSHEVTGYYGDDNPATIRMLEDKWQERFGFPITINSVPGHASRDAPVQVLTAFKANRATADIIQGATQSFFPLFEEGALLKPDWETLYEGLPLVKRLREGMPALMNSKGEAMSDYCMMRAHTPWVLAYNTTRVRPEALQGITFDDLTKPQWRNRVLVDNNFLGVYLFPMAPGWSEERMVAWVKALQANNAKAVAGGSAGLVQAILAGDGDIGMAAPTVILAQKKQGAPVDLHPQADGWMPGIISVTCTPRLTKADPALAELFTFWRDSEGTLLVDEFEGTGSHLFSDSRNAVQDVLGKYGYDLSKMVYPATREDGDHATHWRKLAMDAFAGR
jgi:ABC-type Fe3+ transport system substrate-binding protein